MQNKLIFDVECKIYIVIYGKFHFPIICGNRENLLYIFIVMTDNPFSLKLSTYHCLTNEISNNCMKVQTTKTGNCFQNEYTVMCIFIILHNWNSLVSFVSIKKLFIIILHLYLILYKNTICNRKWYPLRVKFYSSIVLILKVINLYKCQSLRNFSFKKLFFLLLFPNRIFFCFLIITIVMIHNIFYKKSFFIRSVDSDNNLTSFTHSWFNRLRIISIKEE